MTIEKTEKIGKMVKRGKMMAEKIVQNENVPNEKDYAALAVNEKALPKKNEDFSEWYNELIERAQLSDKRYPIKGMNIWPAYGWKLMTNIDREIRKECDATGHEEVYFPLLIPETEFKKEEEHIKGFSQEVYWVTHGGKNKLEIPLLLRPTSETAMYPIFSIWVRSHADLPLKIYQIVNTFRYETKQTRAFIRVREIHFFEAHTCHVDFEDAERQIKEDLEIMKKIAKKLCLPYVLARRPDWDKFAGAYYTIGVDTLMPNGKALQLASIHQYKENFSKPYNITYETENGERKYVHQTTYGMSERLVGAIVGVHGDDRGLILPPAVAPIKVVIIPILAKGKQESVENEARLLQKELQEAGLETKLDTRNLRPGSKFYDWEMKGVPLRLELGPRDIKDNVVSYTRRDNDEKGTFPRGELVKKVNEILDKISENLWNRAQSIIDNGITQIDNLGGAKEQTGILKMAWCGKESCGHKIEDATDKKILGVPVGVSLKGKCIVCGEETEIPIYVAGTY